MSSVEYGIHEFYSSCEETLKKNSDILQFMESISFKNILESLSCTKRNEINMYCLKYPALPEKK